MKKKHLLWLLLPFLAIMLTSEMCSANHDDDDDEYSIRNVVGVWEGYGYDEEYYHLEFSSNMKGDGSYQEDSDPTEYFSFSWKMTGDNKGTIIPHEEAGYFYTDDDVTITFKVSGDEMSLYLNYQSYGYNNSEKICVLHKDR